MNHCTINSYVKIVSTSGGASPPRPPTAVFFARYLVSIFFSFNFTTTKKTCCERHCGIQDLARGAIGDLKAKSPAAGGYGDLGARPPAENEFLRFPHKKTHIIAHFCIEKGHAVSAVTLPYIGLTDNAKIFPPLMPKSRSLAKISERRLQPLFI